MKYKDIKLKEDTYNMLKSGMTEYGDSFDARIKRLIKDSAKLKDLEARK